MLSALTLVRLPKLNVGGIKPPAGGAAVVPAEEGGKEDSGDKVSTGIGAVEEVEENGSALKMDPRCVGDARPGAATMSDGPTVLGW